MNQNARCLAFCVILFLIFFLSSCQNSQSDHSPSLTLTPTLAFTQTLAPTASPSPTLTPTPVLTVLPLITSQPGFGVESTPIAIPSLGRERYRLKDWSEADALAQIRLMEGYARDNDFFAAASSRWSFREANTLIELTIKEMQYRFPTSSHQELVNWHLAVAQAIAEKTDADAWVLDKIESYLNARRFSLAELNTGLAEYGFTAAEQVPAHNLFGDNADVMVYRILPLSSYGSQGIIFAVQGHAPGSYKVTPIFSRWDVNAAYSARPIEIKDHNSNHLPEVVVETADASGTMCFSKVYIFEWDGASFVDLTRGKIGSSDCLEWSFGEASHADTITIASSLIPPETDTYKWNGKYYGLINTHVDVKPPSCSLYAFVSVDREDYREKIDYLQTVLENWPAENSTTLGKSCPDYLLFKIAVAYALHDYPADARSTLRSLSSSSKFSQAAKAFLENYRNKKDLFQSCQIAQNVADKVYQQDKNKLPNDQLQAEWLGDVVWGNISLCDFQSIFPLLVQSLDQKDTSDPIPALKQNGLDIQFSQHVDLDGDGILDWLIEMASGNGIVDFWGLLTTQQGLHPVYITDLEDSDHVDDWGVKAFAASGEKQNIFLILRFEDQFIIYQVRASTLDSMATAVLTDWKVEKYVLQPTDKGLELEVVYANSGVSHFYCWVEAAHEFQSLPLYDNDIFSGDGPSGALSYLERIAASMEQGNSDDYYQKPQLLYLLGLAYELTGHQSQAANLYWDVWHNFPASGYAVMAQNKLEEIP